MNLKEAIKNYAYKIGADLVGFGNIERCEHAPIMMSPQGVFPGSKTVVVMAIHHPDACIELGGEEHPQDIGPYTVQYLMNSRLDEMSYRMGSFIEKQGYGAIPIVSSNIWRYNQYKDLQAIFAPDVSNIYMPVVAGLADMGYNGLALTPEYGARNRFITVITDAVIEPDPLIPPGTVCDNCKLCAKHCPTQAFDKEVDGEKVLKIEDYEYRFPNKNLWRCSWGEHFDLDLDLEIPDIVTEEVIVKKVEQHGRRAGEMGQCLKFCVPKPIREWDRSYSHTPMRKNPVQLDETHESRALPDRILARAFAKGAQHLIVRTAEQMAEHGVDLSEFLPGAQAVVTVAVPKHDEEDHAYRVGANHQMDSVCYDITRDLESFGFRSVMTIQRSGPHPHDVDAPNVTGRVLRLFPELGEVYGNSVITRKKLTPRAPEQKAIQSRIEHGNQTASLTRRISRLAEDFGADIVGVSSVDRLNEIAEQLRPHYDGKEMLVAWDHASPFKRWQPKIETEIRKLRVPGDYVDGAKSVIVFALRIHESVVRWATRPPAEAVGPYSFQTYVTNWLGSVAAMRLVNELHALGYKAHATMDLLNAGSVVANPRGLQPDLFGNRFAALAAGLGDLAVNGHVVTPQFGIRQRFIAVVTDADLEASELRSNAELLCGECDESCVRTCPTKAIGSEEIRIVCAGASFRFRVIDSQLCDWSKRYALAGDSGFKFLGSPVDRLPGDKVTAQVLDSALREHDPVKKYRPVVAAPCVINCPYGREIS